MIDDCSTDNTLDILRNNLKKIVNKLLINDKKLWKKLFSQKRYFFC